MISMEHQDREYSHLATVWPGIAARIVARISVILAVITISGFITVTQTVASNIPFDVPEEQIRPLRQLVDKSLQAELETHLNKNKLWAKLINNKKMAVGLVDVRDPRNAKFARVNGSVMMYAASLPKLAILLSACASFEDGSLTESAEVIEDLRRMIQRSSNIAASRMIERIGMDKIEKVLRNPKYELYDPKRGGGLWVGKLYARTDKRRPDPVMGLSHGATVTQVCRFYYLLVMGKLVNRERSLQMLGLMQDPKINHKFVKTLHSIVPDARVYRKSGTWKRWHSDSVFVFGPRWRRYIAVALLEDQNGEHILRDLIPVLETVLRQEEVKK